MAAQIADHNNIGMTFNSNEETPVVSKLEATRLALAQEQKKRIDAAVARVTSKKESGKRKGLGERTDAIHRNKKSKTVVEVTNDPVDKKNSIARRMVDRFATMPEPEREEVTEQEQEQEPVTRSVSVQHFVARSVSVKDAGSMERESRETTEKVTTTTTRTIVNVTEESTVELEEEVASADEEEEAEQEKEWDGPTTNFHVKQLGLDDTVDIYAPIAQQEYDVQRVRERTKYMPMGNSSKSLNTSCESVADSDFSKDVFSQESEKVDAVPLSEGDHSETRALAEETEDCEQEAANQTTEVHRTWAKWTFVYTPLLILSIVVLVFALLFAIDWSQERFQFCEMNANSTEGSEEIFSCASFVETQSLIKSTLRKAVEKVQETVQSYFV